MTVDALTAWNDSVHISTVCMLPADVPCTKYSNHFKSFEKKIQVDGQVPKQ
jgi:hypothetical protein